MAVGENDIEIRLCQHFWEDREGQTTHANIAHFTRCLRLAERRNGLCYHLTTIDELDIVAKNNV